MKRLGVVLLFVALGVAVLAQVRKPNPTLTIEVAPPNATVQGFNILSRLYPDGGTVVSYSITIKFTGRSGKEYSWNITGPRVREGSAEVIRVDNWKPNIEELKPSCVLFLCSYPDSTEQMFNYLDRVKYRGYTITQPDGSRVVHSSGDIYPGMYTFIAKATVRYFTGSYDQDGNPEYSYVSLDAQTSAMSFYAGITDTVTMRNIFFINQRIGMRKNLGEFGGQIDGPYGHLYPNRPWIGGILHGFRKGGVLDRYFQAYGLKGFLADGFSQKNGEWVPGCGGICAAYEAYDPDWMLGRDSELKPREALEFLSNFVKEYAKDQRNQLGLAYQSRSLSSSYNIGEYDPKGFIMLSGAPGTRDYLFFSKSGKFEDGENILVIETPPGFVQTLRIVMSWGDLKKQLPRCTPQGCPEKGK